jgi:hypothetical protein
MAEWYTWAHPDYVARMDPDLVAAFETYHAALNAHRAKEAEKQRKRK